MLDTTARMAAQVRAAGEASRSLERASAPSVPSCAHAPTGHYLSAIIDAATFITLEAGLGNRPPAAPLQALGPVLNLTNTSHRHPKIDSLRSSCALSRLQSNGGHHR